MSGVARRVITPVWEWVDRPGLEAAKVEFADDSVSMAGIVVTTLNEAPLRLRYALSLDIAWRIREARLEIESKQGTASTTLLRQSTGWTVDGEPRENLAACADIDIMGSPSTNTLPIQRLPWQPGQTRDFWMAYVRLPDLAVLPVAQRYTELGDANGEDRRFEYLSVESGFRAELRVDADGLVLDYPPFWRRAR